MKKLFTGLVLWPLAMFAAAPPPPATQAEVDAGLDSYKYVTPKTLGLTTLIGTNAGISRAVATNVVTDNALLLTQTNGFAAGITNLAKTYSDATTNATGIRAITAQQTNAPALSNNLYTSFVAYPTNSGTDGQVISKTGPHFKFADDATAAGGLATVATNALLYTTNVAARYDTNTIRLSTGDQTNPDAWLDVIGSAGSVTPHFSVGGATAYWDFNLPVTNADVVHFSSVVVIDPDNMVYGAGTLALPTATGVTPAENDNDTSIATTAYVQTEIAAFGSGQTNVTDTAAYGSTVNSNLTVKGWATVQGNQTNASIVVDTFVVNTNWDASLATNMSGTEIRSGTVADARIASTITRDTEWDTIAEIVAATGSDIVTNTRTAALDIKNTLTSYGHSVYTNLFTVNSAIGMGGTNWDISLGAVTGGITGIIGTAGTTKQYAELNVLSTGDTVFTNPAAFYASDGADSRTLTNGNLTTIAVVWKPGLYTNLIFSWSK